MYKEPKALELASKVETIISIHGEKNKEKPFVILGGLDVELAEAIKNKLEEAGFIARMATTKLKGDNQENICNKGKRGKGVQVEISRNLRKEMWKDKALQTKFIEAIRETLV